MIVSLPQQPAVQCEYVANYGQQTRATSHGSVSETRLAGQRQFL